MRERNPFTESDDENLVEYIARNNPETSGRQGNKLYQRLVENPKRWPWSRSHTWHSWRERYKKNTPLFDRRIKRFQKFQMAPRKVESSAKAGPSKKITAPTKVEPNDEDVMHELFGSFTEDEVVEPEETMKPTTSDEDVEIMSLFERHLLELGERYGFSLGVVKQTFRQFGTLEKTALALQTLNAYMKVAQERIYEDVERLFDGNDQDHDADGWELIPEGVIPKLSSSKRKGKGKEKETSGGESRRTPSKKRQGQSLNFKPLTTDIEDESEYFPPSKTRAGRYTKLHKKGREEEALIAASGGTPTRRASRKFAMDMSRESTVSGRREAQRQPTVIRVVKREEEEEEEEEEERGEREEREEKDEEEEEEEDGDEVEHIRMDVSPDKYEAREPTTETAPVDDENSKLKVEHRKLCSEATSVNRDVLRAFMESQDNNGLWKQQSWEFVKERLAALEEAQIRRQELHQTEAEEAKTAEEDEDESMLS